MEKKQIIGLIVAIVGFILIGITSVLINASWNNFWSVNEDESSIWDEVTSSSIGGTTPSEDYIGIVTVEGTIQAQTYETTLWGTVSEGYQHDTMMDYIDTMMMDDYNKGILMYINSPGGTVYESEELYEKVREYQEFTGRPVWTYMAHYAASGGYYVTASADKIYANINTTTGSIGVIVSMYDLSGLYEKIGVEEVTITSGANKASDPSSEEQRAIYQSIVDESYERFVDVIEHGRGMTEEQVKALADGRIYTASQALDKGLIDEISSYEEMAGEMMAELGVSTLHQTEPEFNMGSLLLGQIKGLIPKSEAEILMDVTEQFESGVPLYYAEQIQ